MPRFTLSLAFTLCLSAAAAAHPQDDRTVPLGTVSTWYSILDGERKVGFAHETLEYISGPRRFRYGLTLEQSVTLRGEERHRTVDVEAYLDGGYRVRELKTRVALNDRATRLEVSPTGKDRTMRWIAPGKDRRSWTIPADADLFALPAPMFYSLRQSGALSAPGDRRVRLLDTRAEGEPVVDVAFRIGALKPRTIGGRPAPVTRVTFLKPPPSSGRDDELVDAWLDRYGRMVEATTRSGLRMIWVRGEREARKGITFLPGRNRRDPLDEGLARVSTPTPSSTHVAAPTVSLDALASTFAMAKKDLEALLEDKHAGRIDRVREGYLKLLATWKAMRATAADEAPGRLAEIDAFRAELETAWPGATHVYRNALAEFTKATKSLALDECGDVKTRIESLRALSTRMEVDLRPEAADIRRWIAQLEPEHEACLRRRELAAMPLEVSGTTFSIEEVRLVSETRPFVLGVPMGEPIEVRATRRIGNAVVNGRIYREGDIEEKTGVRIEKITPHSITVSWKGQLRDVPLHHR